MFGFLECIVTPDLWCQFNMHKESEINAIVASAVPKF